MSLVWKALAAAGERPDTDVALINASVPVPPMPSKRVHAASTGAAMSFMRSAALILNAESCFCKGMAPSRLCLRNLCRRDHLKVPQRSRQAQVCAHQQTCRPVKIVSPLQPEARAGNLHRKAFEDRPLVPKNQVCRSGGNVQRLWTCFH